MRNIRNFIFNDVFKDLRIFLKFGSIGSFLLSNIFIKFMYFLFYEKNLYDHNGAINLQFVVKKN